MAVRATVMGYRRGPSTQYPGQVILRVEGLPAARAAGLVGKRVVYRDPKGNIYRGRVVRRHGARNPLLLARFERPLPGQAIGGQAEILD
ncbi:MAG: 50S ribosomal protein L35ae [Desulfurococcales archaeon]|nr:50S ribosomal protein L35ae [Desulfurococcales archaeon]